MEKPKYNVFIFIILLVAVVYSCKKNEDLTISIEPCFSTPESTIYTYWQFLDSRDYKKALRCFKSHVEDYYDSSLIYPIPDRIESLRVDSIISKKKLNKKTYEIFYRVRFYSQKDKCLKYFITGDKLILTNKGWLVDEVLVR